MLTFVQRRDISSGTILRSLDTDKIFFLKWSDSLNSSGLHFDLARYKFPQQITSTIQRFPLFMLPRNRDYPQTKPAFVTSKGKSYFEVGIQRQAVNHDLQQRYAQCIRVLSFKGPLLFVFPL